MTTFENHLNVCLLTDEDFCKTAADVELQIARQGLRSNCCALYDDTRSQKVQQYDYTLRTALQQTLLDHCPCVVACGTRLSYEMQQALTLYKGHLLFADPPMLRLLQNVAARDPALAHLQLLPIDQLGRHFVPCG